MGRRAAAGRAFDPPRASRGQVFLHDPLYEWALSPARALRVQHDDARDDGDGDGALAMGARPAVENRDARQALLRLRQKLQGQEEGEVLSVEGQVRRLIHEAMDASNLCQMYPICLNQTLH